MTARTFYIVLAVAACWIVVGWALSRWLGGYAKEDSNGDHHRLE